MKQIFRKYEHIWIFSFFVLLVFGVLIGTGTLTSGWHMVDDHEFLEYELIRKNGGTLLDCYQFAVSEDVGLRFRPMFFAVRIILFGLFGLNLTAWSIEKGIEIVFAFFFLYLSARKMKCNIFFSIAFSMVVMVGPQSSVWWKLGTQEGAGILLFSIAFYFLLRWLENRKKIDAVISCLAVLAMSLFKESFLLMTPFLALFCIFYSCIHEGFSLRVMIDALKRNWVLLAVYGIIFIGILFIILCTIGIMSPGYVGIDTSMSPNEYKNTWINTLRNCVNYFVWLSFFTGIILLTYIKQWKILISSVIMGCAVVIPQMLIYLKTGIEERYILPWSFGVAFLFVLAVNLFKNFAGIRKAIYVVFLLIYLIPNFKIVIEEGRYFTYRGHSVTSVLNAAVEMSDEDTYILSAYSPYEESDLTVSCWMELHGRDHVYVWNQEEKTCTDRRGNNDMADVSEMDIILFYNPEDRHYCYDPDIDLSEYKKIKYGTMMMAVRE